MAAATIDTAICMVHRNNVCSLDEYIDLGVQPREFFFNLLPALFHMHLRQQALLQIKSTTQKKPLD